MWCCPASRANFSPTYAHVAIHPHEHRGRLTSRLPSLSAQTEMLWVTLVIVLLPSIETIPPDRPGFPLPATGESTYDHKILHQGHRLTADARGLSQAFPKNTYTQPCDTAPTASSSAYPQHWPPPQRGSRSAPSAQPAADSCAGIARQHEGRPPPPPPPPCEIGSQAEALTPNAPTTHCGPLNPTIADALPTSAELRRRSHARQRPCQGALTEASTAAVRVATTSPAES